MNIYIHSNTIYTLYRMDDMGAQSSWRGIKRRRKTHIHANKTDTKTHLPKWLTKRLMVCVSALLHLFFFWHKCHALACNTSDKLGILCEFFEHFINTFWFFFSVSFIVTLVKSISIKEGIESISIKNLWFGTLKILNFFLFLNSFTWFAITTNFTSYRNWNESCSWVFYGEYGWRHLANWIESICAKYNFSVVSMLIKAVEWDRCVSCCLEYWARIRLHHCCSLVSVGFHFK